MRTVFHVTPNVNGWEVRQEGSDAGDFLVDNKANAIAHAREPAKTQEPSQIVVHAGDGRFEAELTYGDDPRDVPG